MREGLRRIPIRESMTTRILWGGCEKFPLAITFLLAALPLLLSFFLGSVTWLIGALSLTIAVLGFAIAKFISRKDPYMFAILWRHMQYQSFYPAHEGYPGKKSKRIKTIETRSFVQ